MRFWSYLLVLGAIFTLMLAVLACGCGGDDDDSSRMPIGDDDIGFDDDLIDDDMLDDDTVDDDTVDDDTVDDDTVVDDDTIVDDDTGDDDIWPDELEITPEDGAIDVPLNTAIKIVADGDPMDPDELDFELMDGLSPIGGLQQFTLDYQTYYFFPEALLQEDTTYEVHVTYLEEDYTASFTTLADAGNISLVGNADAAAGEFFAFQLIPDEVIHPSLFSALILAAIESIDMVIAPTHVSADGKEFGQATFGGGWGYDFGSGSLEQDYSSFGYAYSGSIAGDNLAFNGSMTINYQGIDLPVDVFFGSGTIGEDAGNPIIEDAFVAVATHDCDALVAAFPYMETLINMICDEETGIFAAGEFHGIYNPIPDRTIEVTTFSDTIVEITVDPPLKSYHDSVNELNFLGEIYDDDGLLISTADDPSGIQFPDCCTQVGPNHYTFSKISFMMPVGWSFDPGDYTVRASAGLYGFEDEVTVSE